MTIGVMQEIPAKKNPIIALILNLFLWGLGYRYLNIKKFRGFPWYYLLILQIAPAFITDYWRYLGIPIGIIIAYDAYLMCKGKSGIVLKDTMEGR